MMDSQHMNNSMVCLELFDQHLLNDDCPVLIQTNAETEPKTAVSLSEGNSGRKTKKRKQSFEGARKDNTEIQPPKKKFYELDPNNNKHSPEMKAKIQKAKESRKFRELRMQKDKQKDELIAQLTAEIQKYAGQLKNKDKVIQEKDETIFQLYHILVQNKLVPLIQ